MGHINRDVKLGLIIAEFCFIIQFLQLQNVHDNVIPIYYYTKHNPILCQNTVPPLKTLKCLSGGAALASSVLDKGRNSVIKLFGVYSLAAMFVQL